MKKITIILSLLLFSVGAALFYVQKISAGPSIYSGELVSESVQAISPLAGTMDLVSFQEGSRVLEGQILAIINTDELKKEKELLVTKISELDALLASSSKPSKKKTIKVSVAELNEQKLTLNAQINVLAQKLSSAIIRSPLTGTTLKKFVNYGDEVTANTVIAEIADLNKLQAQIYVPAENLSRLAIDMPVPILIGKATEPVTGSISWVAEEATNNAYAVKISIPAGNFKVGLPVKVTL